MEEKKNNNIIVIILTILLIIVALIIGYLIGNNITKGNNLNNDEIKEESKEQVEENNQDNTNINVEEKEEETVITPVAYTPKCIDTPNQQSNLLVDIDEIKYNNISEYIQDQNDVKLSITYCKEGELPSELTYNLSEMEKNSVLTEMKSSLVSIEKSGIGGVCVPGLKISYKRNNNEYYVLYYGFFAMTSNDGNIYKIIDKSVNNTLDDPQYCLYNFNNLSSTVSSLYNNLKSN